MSKADYDQAFPPEQDGSVVTASDGKRYTVSNLYGGRWVITQQNGNRTKAFLTKQDMRKFLYGHASHKAAVAQAIKDGKDVPPSVLSQYKSLDAAVNKKRADALFRFQSDEDVAGVLDSISSQGRQGVDTKGLYAKAQEMGLDRKQVDTVINSLDAAYRRRQKRSAGIPEEGSRPPQKKVKEGKSVQVRIPGTSKKYNAVS